LTEQPDLPGEVRETAMKRAVLYLRVSTVDQTTANQERELREVASRIGCEIGKVYKDHGVSGAKGRDIVDRSLVGEIKMPSAANRALRGYACVFRGEIMYIGRCKDALSKRIDQGYGTIHPKTATWMGRPQIAI